MSEQQKDGSTIEAKDMGAVAPAAAAQSAGTAAVPDAAEATKPKRRSGTKAKASPDVGDEPAKPKRARASSRSAKANDGPVAVQEGNGDRPVVETTATQPARLEPDGLPPLPPAPVPTPEGISFMQQHTAFQNALEERSAARRAQLERSAQEKREASKGTGAGPREPGALLKDVASQEARPAHDGTVLDKPAAKKPARVRSGKSELKNSIEAGPELRKESPIVGDRQDAAKDDVQAQTTGTPRPGDVASEPSQDTQATVGVKPGQSHATGKQLDKQAAEVPAASTAIPESVRRKFLKVDSEYFFPDRSPAFIDRGARLATRGEHPEVVVALIDIARERGWNSITVKGTESFRRAAWMEAARNGLQVTGYKPTELDLEQLRQREPANLVEPGVVKEQGAAPAAPRTKAATQEEDKVSSEKSRTFANEKPTLAVKKYPGLVQAYALLDAARKFAEKHMPGHEGQFVAIGKEMIKQQIQEGKEVVGPKIHQEQLDQLRSGSQKTAPAGERKAPSESMVRER